MYKKSNREPNKPVKIIPEGLKGNGTYKEEEYGYVIGKVRKFKRYKNNNSFKRNQ